MPIDLPHVMSIWLVLPLHWTVGLPVGVVLAIVLLRRRFARHLLVPGRERMAAVPRLIRTAGRRSVACPKAQAGLSSAPSHTSVAGAAGGLRVRH